MRNQSVEYVDPIDGFKRIAWISRSVAASVFLFARDEQGLWYVLTNLRGKGTPDYQGYWNCVCGYLDYDEDIKDAACREVLEETGLQISKGILNICYIESDPMASSRQNVSVRMYGILPETVESYVGKLSDANSEVNEVSCIEFKPVDHVDLYSWTFNHNKIIKQIYSKYINIPWYKKVVLKLYKKWFSDE